ncbi:MAG: hypothetical protein H7070_13995 [Saprospiraceae bacterium]|nr:hypothetical protein [Pyrinomonadaceae bacterium]
MISQKCPKCRSTRIRRGYRPTRLWSKILFRYYLLCDSCNLEFKGFAVPGTVNVKSQRRPQKKEIPLERPAASEVSTPSTDTGSEQLGEIPAETEDSNVKRKQSKSGKSKTARRKPSKTETLK